MMTALFIRFRRSSLARNAGWVLAGQGLSLFFQAGYFIFLARVLGSSEYGTLVGVFATVSLFSQYSSFGSGYVLLRYVSADKNKFAYLWARLLVVTILLGILFTVLLYFSSQWILSSSPHVLILLVAINECICSQIILCCSQIFQAFERMKVTAVLGMSANVLRSLLAVALFFSFGHVTATSWAASSLGISIAATVAAVVLVVRWFGWPRLDRSTLLSFHQEGFVFAVSGSTTSIYNDIDKSMLGHFGLTKANAIYTMAYRVIDIATMPIRSLHSAAFPRFFSLGSSGGVIKTSAFALNLLKKTLPLCLAVCFLLYLAAPISPWMFGKSFAESSQSIRWLCLIPVFRCLHLGAGDALTGAGHQKIRLMCQVFAAAINFSINLYLIPRYSWHGAALASLLTDGGLAIINWTCLLHITKSQKSRVLGFHMNGMGKTF